MLFRDSFQLSKRRKTPQGFLEAQESRLARIGVLTYRAAELGLADRDPKEKIKIYRSAEELFNPETIDSFKSVPVTNGHPPKLLSSENAKGYTVGMMKDDVRQGERTHLVGTPIFIDQKTIDDVESGKIMLSNGYTADIDFTPGVDPETGEEYHGVQNNIRGNHVAVVDQGRCGISCSISDEQQQTEVKDMETQKVMFDGVEIDMTTPGAQALGKVQSQLETANETHAQAIKDSEAEHAKEVATKDAKTDALQAELDEAKSKIMDEAQLEQYIADRAELIEKATKITGEAFDGKSKPTAQIKKEAVVKARKLDDTDERLSEAYVDAAWDLLLENVAAGANNNQPLKDHASGNVPVADAGKTPSQIAREKKMEADRNHHKGETK